MNKKGVFFRLLQTGGIGGNRCGKKRLFIFPNIYWSGGTGKCPKCVFANKQR